MRKYLLSLVAALVLSVGVVSASTPSNATVAPKTSQSETNNKLAASQDIIVIIIDDGDGTIIVIVIIP